MPQLKKSSWLAIILFIIAVVLYLLRVAIKPSAPAPPSPVPKPTPLPISTSHGQTPSSLPVTFDGTTPDFPASLPAYSSSAPNSHAFAANLAQQLSLTPIPNSIVLWQNDSLSLNLIEANGTLVLTYNYPRTQKTGIDVNSALAAAEQFSRQLDLGDIRLNQNDVLLIDNHSDFINRSPTDNLPPAQAALAVIPFNYYLDNLPLYYNSAGLNTLNLIINSDLQIIKAVIVPPPQLSPAAPQSLISIGSAINLIESGKGAVLNIYSTDPHPIPAANLTKLSLSQVKLEYRLSSATATAIPYYHFIGQGTLKNQQVQTTEVIVPAI